MNLEEEVAALRTENAQLREAVAAAQAVIEQLQGSPPAEPQAGQGETGPRRIPSWARAHTSAAGCICCATCMRPQGGASPGLALIGGARAGRRLYE